jgi:hypothetical protein
MQESFSENQSLLDRLRKSRVDGATPKDSSAGMPYAKGRTSKITGKSILIETDLLGCNDSDHTPVVDGM